MTAGAVPPYVREEKVPVLVWDVAVRVTHWLNVLLITFSWFTAEQGWLGWHKRSGYAVLTLVLFRIYWGLCGSTTARFRHFLRGPRGVGRYARVFCARSGYAPVVGHNPLGGWNVVAMLVLLLLQGGLGLFAVDVDGAASGPASAHVSFDTGRRIAGLHGTAFNVLLLLIVLHIVAVVVHLMVKRENLIGPMLTGVKSLRLGQGPALDFAPLWRALLGLAACALVIVGLVKRL